MKHVLRAGFLIVLVTVLNACGPTRKSVFPPLVSVQQLHLTTGGEWQLQLRIQNNSYAGVKFNAVHLNMQIQDAAVGRIDKPIDLDIPALSVDIAEVRMMPSAAGAKLLSTPGNAVHYRLIGTITGKPEQDKKSRQFKVHSPRSWLSPVPGITNTWR